MVKKALIALAVLIGLAYLIWGGGDGGGGKSGRYDAPSVTGDRAEPAADFNRALFLDKARNLAPRGLILPQVLILKVARGLSDHAVRITVAEQWKTLDRKVRVKLAQDLWKLWATIFPAGERFQARIVIVDNKDRKLAGSRLLNPSDIWVPEN